MVLGLDEDYPKYNMPKLSPADLAATKRQIDLGLNASPESEYQSLMNNVDQSSQLLPKADDLSHQNRSLGMLEPDAGSQAIADRSHKLFDADLNRLQRQTKLDSTNAYAGKLGLAAAAAHKKHAYDMEVYKRNVVQSQNEEAARNQVISLVLGAVGGVAGAYFGGPVGAAGGFAVGSAAGNAIQGSGSKQTTTSGK